MKRFVSLVLALAMIMSLSISAFASDHSSSAIDDDISIDVLPSPIAVLREDPNEACGISSHRPPAGYRYVGSTSGNSQVELVVTAIGCNLVGLIPGLGTLMFVISSGVALSELEKCLNDDILYGRYYKYEWSNGTNHWYHIVWVTDYDHDGIDNYVTCKVETR